MPVVRWPLGGHSLDWLGVPLELSIISAWAGRDLGWTCHQAISLQPQLERMHWLSSIRLGPLYHHSWPVTFGLSYLLVPSSREHRAGATRARLTRSIVETVLPGANLHSIARSRAPPHLAPAVTQLRLHICFSQEETCSPVRAKSYINRDAIEQARVCPLILPWPIQSRSLFNTSLDIPNPYVIVHFLTV